MFNLFDVNGLVFFDEKFIRMRHFLGDHFYKEIQDILIKMNSAWRFVQIEAPLLMPRELVNQNYTDDDIFVQGFSNGETPLVLRPETTPGSYRYASHVMKNHSGIKPPFVVWQIGKSFRREQDQVSKNMRLKEFYQQEFQCIYTQDSANDYYENILPLVEEMFREVMPLQTRLIPSDRLPAYSLKTMDVEVWNGDKWMEICSISKRIDFPHKAQFQGKSGITEKDVFVLEVAIGLDRCVYNFFKKQDALNNGPVDE
jgi:glycyl-tRNA synthetase